MMKHPDEPVSGQFRNNWVGKIYFVWIEVSQLINP
ncbi:MAG: hypothetical protein ACI9YU_000467 [Flavobacteriales bacterium]|jgi:hypothetical protein